jgi:hypothetical protein
MKVTKEDIQKILYSFANMKITKTEVEYNTLFELLQNHPDYPTKVGCGVDYFFVQRSKWKFNQFNFMIQRLDGSSTDFSFNKCLNPQGASSKTKNYPLIFRDIIKDQVDSFRSSAFNIIGKDDMFTCSQTKLKFKKIYAHIDHVYPLTFDSIYNEFLKIKKLDLEKLELSGDLGTSEAQKIKSKVIIEDFYNFHKERAVLRVVYSKVNLQAKKTKNYNNKNPSVIKKELLKKYPQYHLIN